VEAQDEKALYLILANKCLNLYTPRYYLNIQFSFLALILIFNFGYVYERLKNAILSVYSALNFFLFL
jgi:hypothetical protein